MATGLFPSVAAAQAIAEKGGIRHVHAAYSPLYLPSTHHAPPPWPGRPHPPGVTNNRALWEYNAETMNVLFGAAINDLRVSISLPAFANARDHVHGLRPLAAADPALWPWQPNELCDGVQTAAWILPDNRPLPPDLLAFLGAAEAPVYAGFGSMTMQGPGSAHAVIAAIRAQGRRALLARGWAGLALIDDQDDCLTVGDINQQTQFPRVAAVIHHSGAGTTTAARAGAPQIIVPQVVDQPYWGARFAALGIGAVHEGRTPMCRPAKETDMPDILHRIGIKSSARDVYKALNTIDGIGGWWTSTTSGESKTGGQIRFQFGDRGFVVMNVLELAPSKRILWEMVDGAEEWIGTRVSFDLEQEDDQATVMFKHMGWKAPVDFMHH